MVEANVGFDPPGKVRRSASNDVANDNVAHYSDTHSSLAGKSVIYRVAAINVEGRGLLFGTMAMTDCRVPTGGDQQAHRTKGEYH